MEQKANTFLETEGVGKLMAKYAVPCVISLLVAALYNIVDQIFMRLPQPSITPLCRQDSRTVDKADDRADSCCGRLLFTVIFIF